MVKLAALPEQSVIDGFKGVIDFYMNYQTCDRSIAGSGIPCARSWPRSPGHDRAPSVKAGWDAFAWAAKNWNSLDPYVQEAYRQTAQESNLTPRDLFMKGYITDYFREGQWDILSKDPEFTPEEIEMLNRAFAYMSANLNNLVSGTDYKLPLDTEEYDVGADFDTTNNWFLVPKDGFYLTILNVGWDSLNAVNDRYIFVKADGAEILCGKRYNTPGGAKTDPLSSIPYLSAGQKITAHVKHFCGINTVDILSYKHWTNFSISLLEEH